MEGKQARKRRLAKEHNEAHEAGELETLPKVLVKGAFPTSSMLLQANKVFMAKTSGTQCKKGGITIRKNASKRLGKILRGEANMNALFMGRIRYVGDKLGVAG